MNRLQSSAWQTERARWVGQGGALALALSLLLFQWASCRADRPKEPAPDGVSYAPEAGRPKEPAPNSVSYAPERPPAAIYASVLDLTTGFAGDVVNLEIDNYGTVIAPSLLATVGDAITLTSWPGLLPIATSKSVVAGTGAGMGDPGKRESRISLAIPLDRTDDWFAVHIGPLPSTPVLKADRAVASRGAPAATSDEGRYRAYLTEE